MAEGILYDLAAKALESLAQRALNEAASWCGARGDLKKLEETIGMIQARVSDAERYREEENCETTKRWLWRLKLVLYQADDLFDEVITVDRQKRRVAVNKRVCVSFSWSNPLCFNWKMAREIKSIRQQLDGIKSDMAELNLKAYPDRGEEPQPRLMRNREIGHFVNKEAVIGRKNDYDIIIGMLLDPNYDGKKFAVIPIVGFGGLGKTTLAQFVFNDEVVQKHFDLTEWACVPEKDNKVAVMRRVCQSLTGKDSDKLSVDQIESGICQSIKDKKFLLVLDDIWDDSRDNWLDLLRLFECGQTGSKVIVTTRSGVVANAVGTTKAHNLGLLTKEDSWNLFKRFAFKSGEEESNPKLTQIGMEIVDSCGNVPLAIRVVGSLLYTKHSEKQWQDFRNAQLSKAKLIENGNIGPVLKLSYDYLAPALKHCFAYCSLFPKDYTYEKADLVEFWMAQGYLEHKHIGNGYSLEDIGNEYFLDLLGRSLFQDPEEDEKGNIIGCKMHDLVHELAQQVAGDECMLLGEPSRQITDRLIHVNLGRSEAPSPMLAASKMRSLLGIRDGADLTKLFSRFSSLRVLNLEWMNLKTLPCSIGGLRHLRYLNLRCNRLLESLPDAIIKLDNLQTLNLQDCRRLKELPRKFAKLSNLRHLVLDDTYQLEDLPSGFGKMTSLHELNRFIVGKSNGIDSVPASNLMGALKIDFLEWRKDAVLEAQRAILKDNHHLTDLSLVFQVREEGSVDVAEMDEMLKSLQLPQNLENLTFHGHKGVEMPRKWLDMLSKLVSIEIRCCSNCRVIPHLSRLPFLKFLSLWSLKALEYVEDEDDICVGGSGGRQSGSVAHNDYFPSLEILKLKGLEKLKGWTRPLQDGGEPARQLLFPCLSKLKVKGCPKLMSMPLAPELKSLVARRTNWKVFESNLPSFGDLSFLEKLEITNCEDLGWEEEEQTRSSGWKGLRSLHSLKLEGVKKLKKLPQGISCLTALEKLEIRGCENLTELPEEMGNLSRLSELVIDGCPRLVSLPPSLISLASLSFLEICNLENLTELPEEMGNLSRLSVLWIHGCPRLVSLPPSLISLASLSCLIISDLENLTELPEEMGNLSRLSELRIYGCPRLVSLPPSLISLASLSCLIISDLENLTELPEEMGNLSRLSGLQIYGCPRLVSLPPSLISLTSLRILRIKICPHLQRRYGKPNGEDYHLIEHIPDVEVGEDWFRRR